jgi:DNA gyrase subunit B
MERRSRSWPPRETFTKTDFDFDTLEDRLRELAFLNSGVNIYLTDNRSDEARVEHLHYEGGINSFVEYLDRSKKPLIKSPVSISAEDKTAGITVETALEWTDAYHESMLCFTNNIPQRDGGTHLQGFRSALTRVIGNYADEKKLHQERDLKAHGR